MKGCGWAECITLPISGYDSEEAKELMRLYQTIHSDHEVRPGRLAKVIMDIMVSHVQRHLRR